MMQAGKGKVVIINIDCSVYAKLQVGKLATDMAIQSVNKRNMANGFAWDYVFLNIHKPFQHS